MPQVYISLAERQLLTYFAAGKFSAEDRQLYADHVAPRMVNDLVRDYGADAAVERLERVIERVEMRRAKARDRRNRYELACYSGFLQGVKAQIENGHIPGRKAQKMHTILQTIRRALSKPTIYQRPPAISNRMSK